MMRTIRFLEVNTYKSMFEMELSFIPRVGEGFARKKTDYVVREVNYIVHSGVERIFVILEKFFKW